MIRIQPGEPSTEVLAELARLQRELDALPTYPQRVRAAVDQWHSRRQLSIFRRVEEALAALCSGAERCMFCEDNAGNQIEHFRPRSLYPGLAYAWVNYLYACGQCNLKKGDRFAIFSTSGDVLKLSASDKEPEHGPSVLIDPRHDDPLDYLQLDLKGGPLFVEKHTSGAACHRARYTIDSLGLNTRTALVGARRVAYEDYVSRLKAYIHDRSRGADAARLEHSYRALQRRGHFAVWREMKRQHQQIDELRILFEEIPEALAW